MSSQTKTKTEEKPKCMVVGCDLPARARKKCGKHYQRERKEELGYWR